MDLERLRHFIVVADRASLREAGDVVGLSPSALSRSLKALEAELGTRLFRVEGRRLVLTGRGQNLRPLAARLVEDVAALKDRVLADSVAAPVRFASHSIFTTHFMGYALRDHPGARSTAEAEQVFVRNLAPGAIEASIASMESDIGLTYFPVPTPGVELVPTARIAMGVFVRRGAFRGVPFDRIPCSVPLLRLPSAPQGPTIDAWPETLPRTATRYHFDLLETALETCRQGLSWGYFPLFTAWLVDRQVRPEYGLELLHSAGVARSKPLQAFLAKRVGDAETPAMKRIARALHQAVKEAARHFSGR
jgi:DNA-binding transcriptional LysR family regulator